MWFECTPEDGSAGRLRLTNFDICRPCVRYPSVYGWIWTWWLIRHIQSKAILCPLSSSSSCCLEDLSWASELDVSRRPCFENFLWLTSNARDAQINCFIASIKHEGELEMSFLHAAVLRFAPLLKSLVTPVIYLLLSWVCCFLKLPYALSCLGWGPRPRNGEAQHMSN